eukprot:m.165065 g.165065  ORF g.165065 m.165065 type:complete len:1101 (-) comp31368_c0_seq1:40-3342(-)
MDAQALQQLESVCTKFYEGSNAQERADAQRVLLAFNQAPDCINKCRQILDQSKSPYANALAASTLTKMISKPSCPLLLHERLQIRNYALEYLATRIPSPYYVVTELCKLVCRVAKYGWFDADDQDKCVMQDLPDEINNFLNGSVAHCIVGVLLFENIVTEMNQPDNEQGLTKHRKVMSSFRDLSLFKIFQAALDMTLKLVNKQITIVDRAEEKKLAERVLNLGRVCLSFDFLGTNTDESTDDTRTAQLPSTWRDTIAAPNTMEIYFRMYMTQDAPVSALAMTCLVQLASARRTLFTNQQRTEYLERLVICINKVFETSHGLENPDNYHEFCRLLARLKTNFQLSELVNIEGYTECISRAADFTVKSLRAWNWANNSLHYLLSLWDRMISSIPFVKSDRPHGLEQFSPKITEAYIQARVAGVEMILRDGLEDPLDDIETLEIQMKQISVIARCEFDKTSTFLVSLFDPIANEYTVLMSQGVNTPQAQARFKLLDGQLTWLVFIIGSVIGTRTQISPTESYDTFDAELIFRALSLMKHLDDALNRSTGMASEGLNVAVLNFLQHFRLSFIGEAVPRHSKLYTRLSETIGIEDETMVLDVLVDKIITNLKFWMSDMIISKTLKLLSDLCLGYSSLRRLVKSQRVQFILDHHTPDHFRFLSTCEDTRHRTTYYNALGRIMSSETTENDSTRFEKFLAPLGQVMYALLEQLSQGDAIRDNVRVKDTLRGAMRDIRGILQSLTSKPSFILMFEWLYPTFVPVMIHGVRIWFDDDTVAIPILKCMTEFVHNKNSRLQMHTSSPNGILLFRETSKILVAYGERIVQLSNINPANIYKQKYKGITCCFLMLRYALLGDYVNFGVFKLYGDDALDVAFNIFFKLLVSVPLEDLLAYPKLCKAYYLVLVAITRDHLPYVANLGQDFFGFLCSTILEGIKSVDVQICTQCCTCLDYLLSFIIIGLSKTKQDETALGLSRHMQSKLGFLNQTMLYLLNLVMFEDCKNQWSVSRPLLGMIIIQPGMFREAQQHILNTLPAHKREGIAETFRALMEGIESTLSTKNRDKFTQNLAVFRRDINNFAKSAASTTRTGLNADLPTTNRDLLQDGDMML